MEVYRCEICGQTVRVLQKGEGQLVCCGQPMKPFGFSSAEDILDFAIEKEEEAHQFYIDLAEKMARPEVRGIFRDFASEELKHKAKLQEVKAGKLDRVLPSPDERIADLKIVDYLVDIPIREEFGYQEALITAMKREKASFKLYNDLAEMTGDEELRSLFLSLAQEEAKHKLRLEMEYDEAILTEN